MEDGEITKGKMISIRKCNNETPEEEEEDEDGERKEVGVQTRQTKRRRQTGMDGQLNVEKETVHLRV